MRYINRGSRHCHGGLLALAGIAVVAFFVLVSPGGVDQALATTLTSPYVAVTVQAGQTVTLDVNVGDTVSQRVDLSVQGVPEGWEATILGGGRPVTAVMTDPEKPLSLDLQVKVPADAADGTKTLTVVGRSGGTSISLPFSLTVSDVEGGTTELTSDYGSLRGPADAQYTFAITLKNNTLEERTYNLSVTGPETWTISLKPAGASQETPTVTVQSQGSQKLNLSVKPGPYVEIGTYDVVVTATGGGETVTVPLQVEVTGTYTLTLTTVDGSLNADVKAGETTRVEFLVTNSGTGPLQGIELYATAPSGWDVTFEPKIIELLDANTQQNVTAVFKPAENAIAGDYIVTTNARADQASAKSDIRVTVKTSTLWGVIGVLIAVAVIAILGFIFRRYGHR